MIQLAPAEVEDIKQSIRKFESWMFLSLYLQTETVKLSTGNEVQLRTK